MSGEIQGNLRWVDEVHFLYVRSPDMDVDEFERLLDIALRGERPDHPCLPAYLPFETETYLR